MPLRLEMRVGSHDSHGGCGRFCYVGVRSAGHGLYTWMSDNGGASLDYVAGAILSRQQQRRDLAFKRHRPS